MTSITPYIPQNSAPGELQDAVMELWRLDAALNSSIPASLRHPMVHLLRVVNSFYSNKIEGNPTHPADILHAQEEGPQPMPSDALLEIKRHVEVQTRLANLDITKDRVISNDFLSDIHLSFYQNLPDTFLNIENPDTREVIRLIPGRFRDRTVKVGIHVPPLAEELPGYLNWFQNAYNPAKIYGTARILAAAASHHRLMWIHPFLDGNGRVGRLFTDNYLQVSGLSGYGLWSISRGFGRNTKAYYDALSAADTTRQGVTDGRGILSDKGLLNFTEYFIETALDQVKYFSSLLEPQKLRERIEVYFEMRARGVLTDSRGELLSPLKPETKGIYNQLLYSGPKTRAEIMESLNVSERTLRTIISQMEDAGLVKAPAKQPVTLALSPSSIELLFPHLW